MLRAQCDIGAAGKQKIDNIGMVFPSRPHQRRLAAEVFHGIHVRALGRQQLRNLERADAGGQHERGLAVLIG
jgi:hypothetical protein